MDKPGYVYIVASRRNGTIYIGVTSDLPVRNYQHKIGAVRGLPADTGARSSSGTRRSTTSTPPVDASSR